MCEIIPIKMEIKCRNMEYGRFFGHKIIIENGQQFLLHQVDTDSDSLADLYNKKIKIQRQIEKLRQDE